MRQLLVSALFIALSFVSVDLVKGQQAWTVEKLDANSVPEEIVPDNRPLSSGGLPDGRVAIAGEKSTIRKAWYSKPTGRYNHGILGDKIEAGILVVETNRGIKLGYKLPETEVFEDITPRLADLDGDGKTEVITIQSSLLAGASLAIYQVNGGVLELRVRSAFIGRPNRWLNIAGIANYTGNKTSEIALVVTPHIGGRLDLFKFHKGKLYRLMSERGFSNHFIGSREQRLSASYRENGMRQVNLALPSADRKNLMIMKAGPTGWVQEGIAPLPAPIDKAIGVALEDGKVKFTVGLSNGSVYAITKK